MTKVKLPGLMPGAEPRFYRGSTIGCLIVHGFMASPAEVGWLGQHLSEAGYTVSVPRLPGHGVDPTHMARMRWQDWYAHTLDTYQVLRQQCERVFVIGHSMGGLLVLLLATAEPVDGVVAAAVPLSLPSGWMPFTRWLSHVLPYTMHPNEQWRQELIIAEQERRGETPVGRVHYAKWATRAIHELYCLCRIVPDHLPQINAPVLALYAQHDPTIPLKDQQMLVERAQNTDVESYILQEGAHIIFQDQGRAEAFRVVEDFIARQAQAEETTS